MASHVPKPSQKSIEEMMKDLKVNPRAKVNSSGTDPAKERSKSNTTCCVPSAGDVTGSVVKGDAVNESLETYQGLPCPFGGYYGYYFPGYDGYVGELNDQLLYSNGLELQDTVMQRENGSFVYYMPGVHPFYDPNNAYVPQNSVGIDGQFVNQQYTQVFAYPAYFPNAPGYGDPISLPYMWDSSVSLRDGWHEGGYNVGSEFSGSNPSMSSSRHVPVRHTNQRPSLSSTNNVPGGPGTGYQSKASSKLGLQGKGHSPNQTLSYNQEKGTKDVKVKTTPDNTVKDSATFNEKNLGSRISNGQDPISNVNDAAELVSVDVNVNKNREASVVRRDLYNLSDFQTKYDQASFFVIKSYSEDDIHKSIKYGVWSSTLNGNKKLDNAYKEAQKKIAEKGGKCPVFLFFSVNASGQFCGVAEMIGNVNYEKSMDFWQQDKWTGYFPVKWHIVKDVPNPQLRHIILENNENKPVTNSRDTQEVRLPQGLQILNIFKNYASKTSILDDFEFYESREKVMQQKRIRSRMTYFDRTKITENQTVAMQPMGISAAKITQPENDKKTKE